MKKLVLIIVMLAYAATSNSQETTDSFQYENYDAGLGYGFANQDFILAMDFQNSKGVVFGIQGNIGFDSNGSVGEDYSDIINVGQYTEDIYELAYESYSVAVRFGKAFAKKISVIGALGLEIEREFQNRYDNFNIFGDNGNYYVETGNNKNKLYISLNAKYRATDRLALEYGYGSRGVDFKMFFKFN